jgi:hypothetical protein
MGDQREFVSLEVAAGMLCLQPGGKVHTFRQAGPFLLGASWERDQIIAAMRRAPAIEVTGEAAQALGHGLCIHDANGALFIETQAQHAPALSVWTLFDSPADAPGRYVLRRFEAGPGEPRATAEAWTSENIEALRAIVRGMGLYCLGREEADEPHIVESWI